MFGVRCPPIIASPEDGASTYLEDFEGTVSAMGEIVSEVEPLCGRFSVKNPTYIYQTGSKSLGVKIGDFKKVVLTLGTLSLGLQTSFHLLRILL